MTPEYELKAKQFRDLWFSTWRLTYGDEWVNSDAMWAIKNSIGDVMGNYYSVKDAQRANEIDSKIINGYTYYKIINRS